MPLWLLLAPRIADVAISRGIQEVKNSRPKENCVNFWKTRMGGLRRAGGRTSGRADGGGMGGRADGTENGGGQADERTGR